MWIADLVRLDYPVLTNRQCVWIADLVSIDCQVSTKITNSLCGLQIGSALAVKCQQGLQAVCANCRFGQQFSGITINKGDVHCMYTADLVSEVKMASRLHRQGSFAMSSCPFTESCRSCDSVAFAFNGVAGGRGGVGVGRQP